MAIVAYLTMRVKTLFVKTPLCNTLRMSTDIELGALLRSLRSERGEPLRVVAAAAGMDSTLLSRIERGERLPTSAQLRALAAHFGVSSADLEPLNNAARMMRRWASADDVLRAADVIESRSDYRRSDRSEPTAGRAEETQQLHARLTGPHTVSLRAAETPATPDPRVPRSSRAERMQGLEEAAAAGAVALDHLERASRDRDSVVALRATELLRQLRSRSV